MVHAPSQVGFSLSFLVPQLRALAAGLALWLTIGPVGAAFTQAPQEDWISQGEALIRSQQLEEALQLFDRIKQQNPEDSRPYFYSGVALLEVGRLRQAGAELRGALERDPDRAEYVLIYAEVLQRLGLGDSASTVLEPLQAPESRAQLGVSQLWLLSDLYLRLDRLDQALEVLDLYQQLRPTQMRATLRRGEILLRQGDYGQAQAIYRRALAQDDSAAAHYGLGIALWKQGRLEEARRELESALELDPENPEYRYQLGMVVLDQGNAEEALAYLEPLEAVGDRFPFVYSALSRAYRRVGNRERSAELLERFRQTQVSGYNQETAQRRADAEVSQALENLQQGQVEQARRHFEQALKEFPDHWVAHKYLARINLTAGQWAGAYQHLEFMQKAQPEDFDTQSLLAEYWYQRQFPQRAQVHAEQAKRVRPGDPDLRNLLGNIYLSLGLREQARIEYEAAVRLAPDRAEFKRNLESLSRP